MKSLLLVLLVLAACASCPEKGFDLADRMSMKVETPISLGSAWPLTEDSFITAAHVVGGWPPGMVTVNGLPVESFELILGQDAVILHMATPHGYTPWPIDVRELLPGERVYKSGWGQSRHWWSEGFATNDQDRLSLDICPGDSGGPVLDSDGEVIGMIVGIGKADHHAWIIPLTELDLGSLR